MNKKIEKSGKSGFTLLIAVVTTAMLILVSFVVVNVALKQLTLAYSGQESQYAFYAADSGTECAIYWDLKNSTGVSAFSASTQGNSISCSGQTISTYSQSVPTVPSATPSIIGGVESVANGSIFYIPFTKGCAIVRVIKQINGSTVVNSNGYNTCDTSASRRFERGVTLTY